MIYFLGDNVAYLSNFFPINLVKCKSLLTHPRTCSTGRCLGMPGKHPHSCVWVLFLSLHYLSPLCCPTRAPAESWPKSMPFEDVADGGREDVSTLLVCTLESDKRVHPGTCINTVFTPGGDIFTTNMNDRGQQHKSQYGGETDWW